MKITLRNLCVLALISPAIASVDLPQWDEAERKKLMEEGWIPGAALLLNETLPGENAPTEGEMKMPQPTGEEAVAEDEPSREVPEKLWAEYFDQRPKEFLVDPQNLLSPVELKNRLAFLKYHAGDSALDLYVYVFRGDQIIPGEVREEELAERFFSQGKPAVLVMYYLGAPQRSRLFLSPSIAGAIPVAECQRAMESSVMQAFRYVDASGQFEAFLVQMSIRAYWMERMLQGAAHAHEGPAYRVPIHLKDTKSSEDKVTRLRSLAEKMAGFRLWILGGTASFLVLFAWRVIARFRRKLVFPVIEVEPRLGGAHAAGVGAVISFASRAVSPSAQKDAVPDYLRRM